MASVSDFLWNGSKPPNVTSTGTQTQQVPQFLYDYMQGTLNKANKIAAQPYQTYKGQRIAKVDNDLAAGWNMAAGAADDYKPAFGQAGAELNQAAAGSAQGAAQPYLNQANGINAMAQAQPAFQQAGQINATGAAQPYFQQAEQTAYSNVNSYLSPYQNAVVDQIGRKGQENLQQSLHTMGDDFIRAGGLGSSRHMSAAGKAMSDTQEAVSNAQGQALNQGYQTALGAAQNDMSRFAQIGQAQGNLALGQQQNMTQLGQAQGNLALGQQQNIANIGQMAGNFNSIDTRNSLDTATGYQNLGKNTQAAGLTGAAALEAVGRGQMGEQQKNLDMAYGDFLNQKAYPQEMVNWMSTLTRGQPQMGNTTYSNSNAPLPGAQYGPSGLSQLAGGLSLMNNLFKAKGGYIDAPKKTSAHGYADC